MIRPNPGDLKSVNLVEKKTPQPLSLDRKLQKRHFPLCVFAPLRRIPFLLESFSQLDIQPYRAGFVPGGDERRVAVQEVLDQDDLLAV